MTKKIVVNLKQKSPFGTTLVTGTIVLYEGPRMPGPVNLVVLKESSAMLQFKLTGLKPSADDVVTQELSVAIASGTPAIQTLDAVTAEATGFECNRNDIVDVSLTDIDADGNRSEPRVQTFTVKDTIAPPVPGEIGLVVTGQT
jgi:hypothetical protein